MSLVERIDILRCSQNNDAIRQLISSSSEFSYLPKSFQISVQIEAELLQSIRQIEGANNSSQIFKEYLSRFKFDLVVHNDEFIETLLQPIFCAEVLEDGTKTNLLLKKVGDLSVLDKKGFFENIKTQLYRMTLHLELHLSKLLQDTKTEDAHTSLVKFQTFLNIIVKYITNQWPPSNPVYLSVLKSLKNIWFISLWRTLTLSDKVYEGTDRFQKRVNLLLSFCNSKYAPFFDDMKKLLILFSLNQTIIPMLELKHLPAMRSIMQIYFESWNSYIQFFIGDVALKKLQLQNIREFKDWKDLALSNFIIMHHLISRRTTKVLKVEQNEKERSPNVNEISAKLYPFKTVNLNDVRQKIKRLSHEVKDHKYLTLFTSFLMRHYSPSLLKGSLEESLTQPFDDKQIIKTLLCIFYYIGGEYFKCYQFIYQLLEREKTNEKNTYIINHIASKLCLKYLDKPEEALVFAKANLDYISRRINVTFPLKVETLYASIAYCYETIGENNPFFVERMDHYARAIQYFELSYESNPRNEDTLFHLALLNAIVLNLDAAYKYIMEALKFHQQSLRAYLLSILLSTAMGDYKKAGLLIEELSSDNKHPLLFMMKAFLEIENYSSKQTKIYLNGVEDEIKDSKSALIEEANEMHEFEELSREVQNLLKSAAVCILNIATDDIDLPPVLTLASKYEHQDIIDYQNLLFLAIDAFVRIKDYGMAEALLELSKLKNVQENEYLYYKGMLCELKSDFKMATEFYETALQKNTNFHKAYLNLAIIHLKVEDQRDVVAARKELEEALRYEESPEVLYHFGKYYEEQGDKSSANHYMLRSLELSYHKPILPFSVLISETS